MVTRTKKIFVGGLSANTVVEDVKQYFEQFGKVSSGVGQCDTLCAFMASQEYPKTSAQQLEPYCARQPFGFVSPSMWQKMRMGNSVPLVPESTSVTLWVMEKKHHAPSKVMTCSLFSKGL